MAGRRAKMLAPKDVRTVLRHLKKSPYPVRDKVIFLLSIRAGLRAAEIAKLEWSMVLDPEGKLARAIEINDHIAKKGSGRVVPIHPELKVSLAALLRKSGGYGPVIESKRHRHMQPNSIVNWFRAIYDAVGLEGCSSHSGRRTFITNAARLSSKAGGSLRDVQILAGHRSIEHTQAYIDGDTDVQRRLVLLL